MVTNARWVREFEERAAEFLQVEHAVAVNSCTSGLLLVWRAYGLSGEVILPSFTFPATGHALVWNGLIPKFVDIDPRTLNLDPILAEKAIGPETVGILAVHTFGNPAFPGHLEQVAQAHGLKLVFDSAHALGSSYLSRQVGSFGDAEAFSLSPTKLVVAGEGGLVATNDSALARDIRNGRDYGNPGDYDTEFVGLSARMSEFNAVVALHTLDMLRDNLERRHHIAQLYERRLNELPGLTFQEITPGGDSTYKDVAVLVDPDGFGLSRDELAMVLQAEGIATRKYFYPPLHQQKSLTPYSEVVSDSLGNTELVSRRVLCLPVFSHLEMASVERICEVIQAAHEHCEDIKAHLSR